MNYTLSRTERWQSQEPQWTIHLAYSLHFKCTSSVLCCSYLRAPIFQSKPSPRTRISSFGNFLSSAANSRQTGKRFQVICKLPSSENFLHFWAFVPHLTKCFGLLSSRQGIYTANVRPRLWPLWAQSITGTIPFWPSGLSAVDHSSIQAGVVLFVDRAGSCKLCLSRLVCFPTKMWSDSLRFVVWTSLDHSLIGIEENVTFTLKSD